MNGRGRLNVAFQRARRERRTALIPYFVACHPSFRRLRELMWDAQEAGATAIELGIPFSDPVADGPVLQALLHAAIERGVTPRKTLAFVAQLRREGFALPILGMTYANLLFAPGYARTAKDWAKAGLDAAIVPDVPWEESTALRTALRASGLGYVGFASPSTAPDRLAKIARAPLAFLYLVAVYGTTGSRTGVADETRDLLRRARRARKGHAPPLCVGFGVAKPAHMAELARLGADGVIVGSALARRIEDGASVGAFLRSMARAGKAV